MAIGDYILCCKCEVKLLYDGDRGNRKWWEERFGSEPKIACPKCSEWQGLTEEERKEVLGSLKIRVTGHLQGTASSSDYAKAIEAKLREKNGG